MDTATEENSNSNFAHIHPSPILFKKTTSNIAASNEKENIETVQTRQDTVEDMGSIFSPFNSSSNSNGMIANHVGISAPVVMTPTLETSMNDLQYSPTLFRGATEHDSTSLSTTHHDNMTSDSSKGALVRVTKQFDVSELEGYKWSPHMAGAGPDFATQLRDLALTDYGHYAMLSTMQHIDLVLRAVSMHAESRAKCFSYLHTSEDIAAWERGNAADDRSLASDCFKRKLFSDMVIAMLLKEMPEEADQMKLKAAASLMDNFVNASLELSTGVRDKYREIADEEKLWEIERNQSALQSFVKTALSCVKQLFA